MKYPRKQDEFSFYIPREDGSTILVSRDSEGSWLEFPSYTMMNKEELHSVLLKELQDVSKVLKILQEDINIDKREQKGQ